MQGRGEKWEASNEATVIGTVRKRREIENQKKKREEESMSLKNNKYARRLAAALMTGAMMVSMMGMTVSAEELPRNVDITKKIEKGANLYVPDTDFYFTVELGDAVQAGENQNEIKAGISEAVSFKDGVNYISAAPAASDIGKTEITVEGKATLTVDTSKFTAPGIYRYNVYETNDDPNKNNYEGMSYSEEVKYFDVYVMADGTIGYMFTDNSDDGKDDGIFTNTYGKGGDGEDTFHDLKITKTVKGNQGNKTEPFDFTVKVTGEANEDYYVEVTKVAEGETTVVNKYTLESGVSKEIEIAHGQTATIYGLDSDDAYEVSEKDYSAEGYTTDVNGNERGTISQDTTIAYTNTRSVDTPTGVILNIAPYILMVALAGVLAFFFLRKRHYEM